MKGKEEKGVLISHYIGLEDTLRYESDIEHLLDYVSDADLIEDSCCHGDGSFVQDGFFLTEEGSVKDSLADHS